METARTRVEDGDEALEAADERAAAIGAVASTNQDMLTLREMIESDARVDRQYRKHMRAYGTFLAANLTSLGVEFATGEFWNSGGPAEISAGLSMLGMLGSGGAAGRYRFFDHRDAFTEIAAGEHRVIENGDRDLLGDLLADSESVLFYDLENGETGEVPGDTAADRYRDILDRVESSHADVVASLDGMPDEHAEAYLEQQYGDGFVDIIENNTLLPVVRFRREDENPDLPDYAFRVELYAGKHLAARYDGLASDRTRRRLEDAGEPVHPQFSREYEWETVAELMDWDDLTGKHDRFDENTVLGYLHDTVASTRDFGTWLVDRAASYSGLGTRDATGA